MKKTIAILGALLALLACNKQMAEPTVPEEGQRLTQVEFTINRADVFPDTKGTAKGDWNDGDAVFVFFKQIASPAYLKLVYSGGTWNAFGVGGLDLSTSFSGVTDYRMTAVFLPYGSDAAVVEDGSGGFTILKGGVPYKGYFLYQELVGYTYEGGKVKGNLTLKAYNPGGTLIHYDVTGYSSGHDYEMYQEYLAPFYLIGVNMTMTTELNVIPESAGNPVPGYIDSERGIVSFSGVLTASGTKDFQFSIIDKTASVLYTRDAGSKSAPTTPVAIGLGSLSGGTSPWAATANVVDLGMKNEAGQHIMWATMNVGATKPEEYGDYFAWGEKTTKTNYAWSTYFDTEDNGNTFTNYTISGGKTVLDFGDDAARAIWGGTWRMPTDGEWTWLKENCTWNWTGNYESTGVAGMIVTGTTGNSIFLPAAGGMDADTLYAKGETGDYWSSSLYETDSKCAWGWIFYDGSRFSGYFKRYKGFPVRPVLTVD